MEWFDVKSIATLLGASPNTVRNWIKRDRLPATKRPASWLDPNTGKRTPTNRLFVSRPHLEDFVMRRWKLRNTTLADLINAAQATGDIEVIRTEALPSNLDRVTLGAETLRAIEQMYTRRGQMPRSIKPVYKTEHNGRRPPPNYRPPVQLELFS